MMTDAELLDRIHAGLIDLRLRLVGEQLDRQIAEPVEGQSRLEWLWSLLEPQVRTRIENRLERRIREARLPERKTFDGFDFDFQPTLDRDLILELATLSFLDSGRNILLAGHSGTGKSHVAKALALNACADNRRVRYTTSAQLLEALNASLADETLHQTVKEYTRPQLLVIDEVGLEQVERQVVSRSGLMQKALLPRLQQRRSTIITSNIPWDQWGDYLDDHLGATALLDRLIHHSHVIVIDGPSWRDHEHQQAVAEERAARRKRAGQQKSRRSRGRSK